MPIVGNAPVVHTDLFIELDPSATHLSDAKRIRYRSSEPQDGATKFRYSNPEPSHILNRGKSLHLPPVITPVEVEEPIDR